MYSKRTASVTSLLVVGKMSTAGMRTNLLSYLCINLFCSKHYITSLASFVLSTILHCHLTVLSLNSIVISIYCHLTISCHTQVWPSMGQHDGSRIICTVQMFTAPVYSELCAERISKCSKVFIPSQHNTNTLLFGYMFRFV